MTLLYMDGFAHGQTARYSAQGVVGGLTASPRVTSGFYTAGSNTSPTIRAFTATSEIFTGVGFKHTSWGGSYVLTFWGDSRATQHISIVINSSGQVEVRRGTLAGTVLATGSTVLTANSWIYLEARVTISDTVGVVQVRLNGSTSNEVNFSGDTKNAGTNTTVDGIGFLGSSNGHNAADWYILDTGGSTNNTWMGDVAVRVLSPSGNGNSSILVGSDSDSTNNYLLVDELPYSSTDYTGSATSTDKDSYAFSNLPAGATTVYAIQTGAYMAKSDAGAKSAKILTRSGGTDYVPTSTTLTTSYVETLEIRETDPATSAQWTVSNLNAAEFGMQVA